MKHNLKKKKSWLQNKVKEVQKACKELEIDYKDFSACIASNRTSKQSLSCICIFYCFSTAMPAPSLSFVLLLYFYCIFPWFFSVYVSFIAFLLLFSLSLYSSFYLFMATAFSFLSVFNVFFSLFLLFGG